MTRFPLRALVIAALCHLTVVSSASAIAITAGQVIVSGGSQEGIVDLVGMDGTDLFTFTGFFFAHGGIGVRQCAPCEPGETTIDIGLFTSGGDIGGPVTIGTDSYFAGLSDVSIELILSGGGVLPPVDRATTTVLVPFILEGSFFAPLPAPDFFRRHELSGSGVATLSFSAYDYGDGLLAWEFRRIEYRFGAQPDPDPPASVPEPGTLTLLAVGCAVGARRLRRRANVPKSAQAG